MKRLDYYWDSVNFVSLSLLPLSIFFCLLSKFRRALYKVGILVSYRAPVKVIVVGNISVGGTGKTPLIIELVRQLNQRGKKTGIISRGYGGNADSWPQRVDSKTNSIQVGDEPQMIYQKTHCPVVVGPNRKQAIEMLLEQFNCDVILSDDGMQHYAMQRDIEIAVVDARKKFGNGFCLPAGPLRERISRLDQVDMVLLNNGSAQEPSFNMQPTHCTEVTQSDAKQQSLNFFKRKTVHAIAGIGNPQRFFSLLEAYDITVIPHAFADHHSFNEAELNFDDDLYVLMTEKDAIKCSCFDLKQHWSVAIDISLSDIAQRKLNRLLDSIN
jgi:tetraacyldisaccharide 4'-kinase